MHGLDVHIFFNSPSTSISILLTPTLSVAVAVMVTLVEACMPEVGECDTETLGGIVSVPGFGTVTLADLQHPAALLHDGGTQLLFVNT